MAKFGLSPEWPASIVANGRGGLAFRWRAVAPAAHRGAHMRQLVVGTLAVALLLAVPRAAMPQARTLKSEMKTESGVVEAVDAASRAVTFKKADGTSVT